MIFSEKMYERLKNAVQVVLPALTTFYLAIANLWGFPYAEQVAGTLAALAAFLGVILKISSKQYNELKTMAIQQGSQGSLVISEAGEGKIVASLELNAGPEDILKMDTVLFEVVKPPAQKPPSKRKR